MSSRPDERMVRQSTMAAPPQRGGPGRYDTMRVPQGRGDSRIRPEPLGDLSRDMDNMTVRGYRPQQPYDDLRPQNRRDSPQKMPKSATGFQNGGRFSNSPPARPYGGRFDDERVSLSSSETS